MLKKSSQKSPYTEAKPTTISVDGYKKLILTSAILPVACETTETGAEITSNSVQTLGKLTAVLLLSLTLIHIWKKEWETEG